MKKIEYTKFICLSCELPFEVKKTVKIRKYCSDACREKEKIRKINENWLNKKQSEVPNSVKCSRFNSHHCNKKEPHPWLKKFQSMRG